MRLGGSFKELISAGTPKIQARLQASVHGCSPAQETAWRESIQLPQGQIVVVTASSSTCQTSLCGMRPPSILRGVASANFRLKPMRSRRIT